MASTAPDANVKATSNKSRARGPSRSNSTDSQSIDSTDSQSILVGVLPYPVGMALLGRLSKFVWAPLRMVLQRLLCVTVGTYQCPPPPGTMSTHLELGGVRLSTT